MKVLIWANNRWARTYSTYAFLGRLTSRNNIKTSDPLVPIWKEAEIYSAAGFSVLIEFILSNPSG
jgi:hypothetical protein